MQNFLYLIDYNYYRLSTKIYLLIDNNNKQLINYNITFYQIIFKDQSIYYDVQRKSSDI